MQKEYSALTAAYESNLFVKSELTLFLYRIEPFLKTWENSKLGVLLAITLKW